MDRCYQCLNYMREYKTHATNCNSTIAPCKHLMENNIDLNLPALDKYFVYKDELACKHFEKDESVKREKVIHKRSASEKEWLKCEIKRLRSEGMTWEDIADRLDIAASTACAVYNGRMWA